MPEKNPQETPNVIPSLSLNGAARAIELYKKAFGAKEEYRMEVPGTGKVMHACISIGNSKIFLMDLMHEMPEVKPSVSSFYVYLDDVDTAFSQAKQAGLFELHPLQDMFWGDRTGTLKDTFGITWSLATHVRDVSPEEMEEGRRKFMEAA